MTFTQVTLTRDYDLADGTDPLTGWVQATPTAPMYNAGVTIPAVPVRRDLDIDGLLALPLVANTDPATTPTGVSYKIEELIQGVGRTYYVTVPHGAGSTLDMATLATATVPPSITYPVPGPAGPPGVPGTASDPNRAAALAYILGG
jgi:hypothetical protein